MKKNFSLFLAIFLALSALILTISSLTGWVQASPSYQEKHGGVPTFVSYQGQILDGATPFNGTGYFKFAVVDTTGNITYWSNDASSIAGSEPSNPVTLMVSDGLFSVNLGDPTLPNMSVPVELEVFDDPYTRLRVWFSPDNSSWTQMDDQVIASVPYALKAQNADIAEAALVANEADHSVLSDIADTLDSYHAENFQMRIMGTCPVGQAIIAVDSNGTIVCENIMKAPTYTISTLITAQDYFGMCDIAIGSDGLGVIAYLNADSGDLNVFHCSDVNCTMGTNQVVDSADNVGYDASIAIGSDGYPLISYFDTTNDNLKVVHCNNVDCSSKSIRIPDPTGDVGYSTSITIGGDGLGLISYYNLTNGNLKVAHCNDIPCSSFTITALDMTDNVGKFTSIATGTDGYGMISYFDSTNENLKIVHCENADCSYAFINTLILSAGYAGTSIAIGADGMPLITYKDTVNFDLWVAHCQDQYCISANSYKLDTTHDFSYGGSLNMTIGKDGLGVISYYDGINSDLKVAHCNNAQCSSATTYALDTTGDAGLYTSITMNMDGLPLIAYLGNQNNDLKAVHCSNELCIPINLELQP